MEHLIIGIFVVIICIIGYFFAWRQFRNERFRISLLLILFCGLIMRVYMASDHYIHDWDERYHAVVAKNLVKHPLKPTLYDNTIIETDYKVWIANNVWLHKPTVPLWFIAASLYTFGTTEMALRLPSLLISLLAVYLTYLIGCYLFDKKTGLLAAFLHSINGLALELAGGKLASDHVETFFDLFVEIAILFCVISIIKKNKYYFSFLGGVFIGLAILSKWLPALIVFPVWLTGAVFAKKYTSRDIIKHLSLIITGCLIITLPYFIYFLHQFPKETGWELRRSIFAYSETIEKWSAPWWYYLNYVEIVFGEIVYVPLIFAVYFLIKEKKEWAIMLLSVWWIIPVVIFSFAETKRHPYLMISAPAYFLITAWYWFYLKNAVINQKYNWIKYLVLVFMIILPVRFCIERMKPFNKEDMNPSWARELRMLNQQINEKQAVIFNSEYPIETMFYTNFSAYSGVPDSATIQKFISDGYSPYVYKNGLVERIP
jgi:4-amino-4-deoxy-L-arabinose transferase-like glycosyltransferase